MGKGQPQVGVTHREGSAAFGLPRRCCTGGQTARVPPARSGCRQSGGETRPPGPVPAGTSPRRGCPEVSPAPGPAHSRAGAPALSGHKPPHPLATGTACSGLSSPRQTLKSGRQPRRESPRVLSRLNGPLQLCCRDYQDTHPTPPAAPLSRLHALCSAAPRNHHGRKATPCSYAYRDSPAAARSPISRQPRLPLLSIASPAPLRTSSTRQPPVSHPQRGRQWGAPYPSGPVPGGRRDAALLPQPRIHRDTAMSRRGFTGQDFYRGLS